MLAYAREREAGFGVGQLNASENGTRKIGIDARARLGENLSLTGSAWHEDYLGSSARRIAGRALVEYRNRDFSGRAGITIADDRLADGRSARSTILQLGATKRFFDNRLELDAPDRASARRRQRQHRLPGAAPRLGALRAEPQHRPGRLL